ncbi:nicotinate-nucleotide pyrophosphorylase [Chloropicon primus]|uniref:Nicotinate-nucleotide pyrophosphorylase [carboxylating] n=1 Tax=Chloropicon primus TaxID=1764295 RepID=A0A5B8MBW3_9CHLO|nr:nicotinate-nucleotide pyrophosphorylase [Chloropicon primus]UPQ96986.1 nicotinate-nucleotide pyrophosphorylase [Chloropicon primus]|mmetsp:Transcript_3954/g.11493  ORF Transcript_3954/g.11493 Transcript_3954/m.11493 type:complete len:311 (-) Transcript_3954:1759-2691(-)|eukprot:QDZ17769.1 nicotinate-nucleotide pyrophosphorylase [Chloropicon primus]
MATSGGVPGHPTFDLDRLIRSCLAEDLGDRGDITSHATVGENVTAQGVFIAKEGGVVAGVEVAERVFALVDDGVERRWSVSDGEVVREGDVLGRIEGKASSLLAAERLALNFMQRMSGVATLTSRMKERLGESPTKILDTRKTVPGLRVLDKWAVLLGGGTGHRMGLYDMMMIKDNHIAAAGGIEKALERADAYLGRENFVVPVEIEVETLEQVDRVMAYFEKTPKTFLTRVMLDNMVKKTGDGQYDTTLLNTSVERIGGKLETEASGNINLRSVEAVGKTGVQFISSGALTHSVQALDISLKLKTNGAA